MGILYTDEVKLSVVPMLNWSVDEEKFKKVDPEGYRLWRIVQLINYGLSEGEKLNREEVKAAWPMIKDRLDPYFARTIEFFLWKKVYSLPPNITFWNWQPRTQK